MANTTVLEPLVARLTDDQLDVAITTFRHYFPEDAALAGVSNEEIRSRVHMYLRGKRPIAFNPAFTAPPRSALKIAGIPDCPYTIGVVVVDCVFVIINFAGLHPPPAVAQAAVVPVARAIAADLPGWLRMTNALIDARTAADQATALFQIGVTAWNVGMWRGIFASIQDSMQWWDWVIAGVTTIASIGAIFLSGGAAFIAQIALSAASFAYAISDAAKIPGACIQR